MVIKLGERISPDTEFKKGSVPSNKLHLGSVTIRIDKSGKPRAWVKVSDPNVWMPRAQFVWIGKGGEIPPGFILHHIDHDSLNDDIDNLALVTRSWHIDHHRGDISENHRGWVLGVKRLTCSKCHNGYDGKAQRRNGLCDDCKRENRQASKARYKEKLRAERRQ